MCNKLLFNLFLVLLPLSMYGQGLKVKKMELLRFDVSASTHLRNDSSGVACGLVKVQVNNPTLLFGKEAVGSVDNKTNEYWVYLSKGTKSLTIKQQNCLPMPILFKDFGIEEIESKTCYLLLLKNNPLISEKNALVINVKPSTANILIDNYALDAEKSGSYKLFLEKGVHVCKIMAEGYRPTVEIVKTGKGVQTLNLELESLMADVNIECQTSDADIYANKNKIGTGAWKGKLPAGQYIIEARKDGYTTKTVSISIAEKESKSLSLPALEKAIIPFLIKTTPLKCYLREIIIDGSLVGSDALCHVGIPSGKHILEIKINGCISIKEDIIITKPDTLEFILKPENDMFASAFSGDYKACYKLGGNYAYDYKNTDVNQGKYWYDIVLDNIDSIDAKWLLKGGTHWGGGKPYEELIAFYTEKVKDELSVSKVLNRLESIINISRPDWYDLSEMDIAKAYKEIKKYKQAITWYERWLPKAKIININYYSYAYEDLGKCYKEMGDLDNALKCLLKAHSFYANYSDEIASLYYEKGDIPNAVIWYKKFYKEAGYNKPDGDFINGNKVDFIKDMKKKGLYEDVVK